MAVVLLVSGAIRGLMDDNSSAPSYRAGHEYGINLGSSMRKAAGQTSMSDFQRDSLCEQGADIAKQHGDSADGDWIDGSDISRDDYAAGCKKGVPDGLAGEDPADGN